jgi:hypothetical protein
MMNWGRRQRLLAQERKWAATYTPTPPEVRAVDLMPDTYYAVLTRHEPRCWLLVGGKCSCRPRTKFFAEPR